MQNSGMFFNFSQSDRSLKKGDILISEPFLHDPNFERSVILICEHNESGTFGLIVNKPTTLTLGDVLESKLNPEERLYLGGPVEQNSLHILHDYKDLDGAIQIGDNIYWGGDFEHFCALHMIRNSEKCRFIAGYSGWGFEQLLDEFKADTWWVYRGRPEVIFEYEPQQIWRKLVSAMGGKFRVFSNYPVNPRLN
jgi:putative transcriptional regulator